MRIESDIKATAAVIALIAVGFVAVCWWPRHQERGDLQARVEAHKKQLGVDRAGAQGLTELRQRVADLRQQALTTKKIVPPTSELADLLRRLTRDLDEHDMQRLEVQTETIVEAPDFNIIPLSLKFEGTYDGVFGFVKSVESMSRLTRINKLEVIGAPTKQSELVSVRLELTTFSATGGTRDGGEKVQP
jgi:Tfp pilus assembly protein PilO